MPVINIPEFQKYKEKGFKGVFYNGCIERGEGSSFRRKAHAHNEKNDRYFGWICFRSKKRIFTKTGTPSMLLKHELAHILTPNHWHDDSWRKKVRELGGRVRRYETKEYHRKRGYGHKHKWILIREETKQGNYKPYRLEHYKCEVCGHHKLISRSMD